MAEAMAAEGEIRDSVGLTTKWFGLNLSGPNALGMFLFIAILGLTAVTIWEHTVRSSEHDQIDCRLKLTLYMQTVPVDKSIDWRRLPTDTFSCVPKFLFDRDTTNAPR